MKGKIIVFSTILFFWTCLILLFQANESCAQEGKIGYIDSMKLRTEFKEFTDAQTKFDQDVKTWQDELTQMEHVIDSLQDDLDKTSLMLSDVKKKEKEDNLEAKKMDYQRATNDVFGPGGKAERRNAELTKPILDKINQVLEKIATEENYMLIFDSVNGNIAYAKKSLDLTDRVLEELKKIE